MSSSAEQSSPPTPGRARAVIVWVRRGLLLYALLAALYLNWRFDVQTLPRDGVSPLNAFRPGAHLLIDRRNLAGREGEALLFRDDLGRLLLGRVAATPGGETRPGLWLVADNAQVALPDSRTLGPIALERVVGRVVCALPSME